MTWRLPLWRYVNVWMALFAPYRAPTDVPISHNEAFNLCHADCLQSAAAAAAMLTLFLISPGGEGAGSTGPYLR